MLRSLAPLAAVLAVILSGSVPIAARGPAAGSATSVSVTRDGMRLTLDLRAGTYPRNALVPVILRLTNLTSHPAGTWDCLASSLTPLVQNGRGFSRYPPILPPAGAPWPFCPGESGMGGVHRSVPIAAGATLTRHTYLILRARIIRATAQVETAPGMGKPLTLLTPPITLRVTAPGPDRPSVGISAQNPSTATVTPAGRGPILYSEYATCQGTQGARQWINISATLSLWMHARGNTISARASSCTRLTEWVLIVGQPGLPIIRAYYCRQHDLCAYAPPTRRQKEVIACKEDIAKAVMNGRLPRSAAKYALGLTNTLPPGLSASQKALAEKYHRHCARLLKGRSP